MPKISRRQALAVATAVLACVVVAVVLLKGGDSAAPRHQPEARHTETTKDARPKARRSARKPGRRKHARPRRKSGTRLVAFGGGGPLIGLADNRPETFSDPRFAGTGIKRVRVAVPFDDVALGGTRRRIQDAYFAAARRQGVDPLVSFYRSSANPERLPSVAEFGRDFELFRSRYPWLKSFSTWNEANFRSQPTRRDPERTAAFYRLLRDRCSGGRCTVVACDFRPDGSSAAASWLERFKSAAGPGRHIWGLSSYVDVNRQSTGLTRDFLRRTSGPVWVTEVGAINFFGRGIKPNIPRQTRRMHFLLTRYPAVSRRIQRLYVYHWRAAAGDNLFDSGLLDLNGQERPAYREFVRAIGKSG